MLNQYYIKVSLSKNNFKNTVQSTLQNKNWCSAVQLSETAKDVFSGQPAPEDAECLTP